MATRIPTGGSEPSRGMPAELPDAVPAELPDAVPAETPEPPYTAVIFTSVRTPGGGEEYGHTSHRMLELARQQPGFLGVETARDELGITVSYWRDDAAARAWKAVAEHRVAQERGRDEWYRSYRVRVARVEREYGSE